MFCLPKEYLVKIKKAIQEGKFSMEKFNTDSQTRRNMLSEIVGDDFAKQVNLIYEQKLLLKNQEAVMYKFLEDITGISAKAKAETKAKIQQAYADKKSKLYDPTAHENLLNEITSDIYSKKYNTEVSLSEAQNITSLAQDMKVAKEALETSGKKGFGSAKVALDNYVNALKLEAIKSEFINPLKEIGAGAKLQAVIENGRVSAKFIAENARSIVASVDNSLWFRQGIKALKDPRFSQIWAKDFAKSWIDIYKTMRGKIGSGATAKDLFLGKDAVRAGDTVIDSIKAEAYERPNFLNGRYEGKVGKGERGAKLDIGTGEEAFPTSKPSMIPLFGRFFKGSEVAYEGGAMRLRIDIADKAYAMAEKAGKDLTSNDVIGEINRTVNQITGRASFGKRGGSIESGINTAFFSVKFFKSNFDYLTSPLRLLGDVNSPGRRLAATNLLYSVATTGVILKIAQELWPDDNKDIFNPTSSNFGKIRSGDATIDTTGGTGGLVVLAARIMLQETTSSTTGITKTLGDGFGSQTGMDVLWSFTENKFSPAFAVLKNIIKQETFGGGKPTVGSELKSLTMPIIVQNYFELKGESGARKLLLLIADGVGLSTSVYTPTTDWSQNPGVELQQFQTKVGDQKFKEANDKYNQMVSDWLTSRKSDKAFQSLPDDVKQTIITAKKSDIKASIFKQYGFKYKAPAKKVLPKF